MEGPPPGDAPVTYIALQRGDTDPSQTAADDSPANGHDPAQAATPADGRTSRT
jgi:hypothetical protein